MGVGSPGSVWAPGLLKEARQDRSRTGELGSTVLEFLASLLLLMAIFLGGLQLGLYSYVRNIAQSVAVEGVRYGIPLGRGPDDAARRASDLLDVAVGDYSKSLRVEARYSAPLLEVSIEGTIPSMVPLLPGLPLSVRARGIAESESLT